MSTKPGMFRSGRHLLGVIAFLIVFWTIVALAVSTLL
jgi:hypothetical protein